jgi:hypothetical protein
LAKVLRFNAIEGVQEGAKKSLASQGIDGAMATFGIDLPLMSDLSLVEKEIRLCSGNHLSGKPVNRLSGLPRISKQRPNYR